MNNDGGCEVTPRTIFAVKSLINAQNYHHHKIEIADSRGI